MNANQQAFPGREFALIGTTEMEVPTSGLTKREYFAAKALQGILSNPNHYTGSAAKDAVAYADELLKQLEQPSQ